MTEKMYIYDEIIRYIATNIIRLHTNPECQCKTRVRSNPIQGITSFTESYKYWEDLRLCVCSESYSAKCVLITLVHQKYIYTPYSCRIQCRYSKFLEELHNRFITPKIKTEFILHYCKMKQVYFGLTLFARLWKIRRTPVRIQTDLYMNELDPKHPSTFQLIQGNGIYLFTFNNLVRIILEAITHQSDMFVEPLPIKNPYTNSVLSKTELFNIYFGMRLRNIRIHELIEKFFRCEFNVYEFKRLHETELRDIAIEKHVKTSPYRELYQDIDDMLRNHNMTRRIVICSGFPVDKLVNTMRPLLKLHFLERYSYSSITRKYAKSRLQMELTRFAQQNPLYGRRTAVGYCIPPSNNPFLQHGEYIQTEPSYIVITNPYRKRYCHSKYMETHIYKEDVFDRYVDVGDDIDAYIDPSENTSILYTATRNGYQETDDEIISSFTRRATSLLDPDSESTINGDQEDNQDNEDEESDETILFNENDSNSDSEYEEDADSVS